MKEWVFDWIYVWRFGVDIVSYFFRAGQESGIISRLPAVLGSIILLSLINRV